MLILTSSLLSNLSGGYYGRGADLSDDLGIRIPVYNEEIDLQNRALYELAMFTIPAQAGKVIQHRDATTDLGTMAVDVFPMDFYNDDALVEYAGVENQSDGLTNDATNYLYLTAAGVLTINTTGFPVPSVTPHVPLATVTAADGAITSITDVRERAAYTVLGSASGSLNDLDWQESVLDELDFTSAEPAAPTLGDRYLNTGTGSSSETAQSVTSNRIEQWNGTTWTEITLDEGACFIIEDTDMLTAYNGSSCVSIGTFALLNEAQAFFAATDISGAQAETLTDGSNADSLHLHTFASGISDGDTVAGNGLAHAGGVISLATSELTEAVIANGDYIIFNDATDSNNPKREALADVVTLFAGTAANTGLSASSCVLSFVPGSLTEAAIADGDYIVFSDTDDSGNPKREALADVAVLFAGAGLTATGSVLAVNVDDSTLEIDTDTVRQKDGGTTAAKLAAAVQDMIPYLTITGVDDTDGTGSATIQVKDAAGNNLAQRFLIKTWIADAEFSEPDAQTDFSPTTGEQMYETEADADYTVISDATGVVAMNIDAGGAKTVYVMAEIDGRIYSSGAIDITSP